MAQGPDTVFGIPVSFASAVIAAAVSLVTAALTAMVTVWLSGRRAKVDEKLATLKLQFDSELVKQKAQLDNRATFAAERVAHELLMHPEWKMRTFDRIKVKLGGFEDDKLRQILVQAGAVRFIGENEVEYWGLLDRNREKLQ